MKGTDMLQCRWPPLRGGLWVRIRLILLTCVGISHIQRGLRFDLAMLHDYCIVSSCRLFDCRVKMTAASQWWRWFTLDRCAKENGEDCALVRDKPNGCKFMHDTVPSVNAFICKCTHLHSNYAHTYSQNRKRQLCICTTGAQTYQPAHIFAEQRMRSQRRIHVRTRARCVN